MRATVLSTAGLMAMMPFYATADLVNRGTFITDTHTKLDWLTLPQTANMSFLDVSAELTPGGRCYGYRYATIQDVETLWTDAGLLKNATPESCGGGPDCFAFDISTPTAESFIALFGNTWTANYGFGGAIGLTSTPYVSPWPGCGTGITCYVTPELRIYTSIPSEALVVEALQQQIE